MLCAEMQSLYGTMDTVPSLRDVLVPGFVTVVAISLIIRGGLKKAKASAMKHPCYGCACPPIN